MVPFDDTPETDEEDDDLPVPDLSALLGGGGGIGADDGAPAEDPLATDSLDALRDEELTESDDVAVDPAKAAVIEATGKDDDDDDIEDLEELERDGFGRERDFGFDSIDEEEEEEEDDDY
jgi:hypothetical protein